MKFSKVFAVIFLLIPIICLGQNKIDSKSSELHVEAAKVTAHLSEGGSFKKFYSNPKTKVVIQIDSLVIECIYAEQKSGAGESSLNGKKSMLASNYYNLLIKSKSFVYNIQNRSVKVAGNVRLKINSSMVRPSQTIINLKEKNIIYTLKGKEYILQL